MTISAYLANAINDAIFNSTDFSVTGDVWVSLHNADPGATGASEVVGGTYARQQVAFGVSAAGIVVNTASIDFTGLPTGTITHVGLWNDDGSPAGNFLKGQALSVPRSVTSPGVFSIGAGRFSHQET